MGKLHEVLAVETGKKAALSGSILEIKKTFEKTDLFRGQVRTLSLFNTNESNREENQAIEAKARIEKQLATTVPASLNYLASIAAEYYDVVAQKEFTNQQAKADVVIDNVVIIKDAPVSFLLHLEARLGDFREIILNAPTLDVSKRWTLDESHSLAYVHVAPETTNLSTKKEEGYEIIVEATQHHPAQTAKLTKDVNVGRFTEIEWSGAVSSADKAKLLERLDALISAAKTARCRANDQEILKSDAGQKLMGYLFGAWFDPKSRNPDAKV